ncbi:MAG: alkaline phosphatase family protein [Proteobacteria bacterium]|nr:alkaline phosphatase family protein [Pseudomonadota bacterium]
MVLALIAAPAALAAPPPAPPAPPALLLVSIDGLRPVEVLEAQARGARLPVLTGLLAEGAHARVVGVLPTITYPSHTTLITGAAPARHGILSNTTFDPLQANSGGWYWYAEDIKVDTLWQAARRAGLTTGNVQWPVTVGVAGVDWNLPQIWRSGTADDAKLGRVLATPGLTRDLETRASVAVPTGIDETPEADEARGRLAEALIASHGPRFLTTYFTAFDDAQHQHGPDSPEARAVLERIDAALGRVLAAERARWPQAVVALVSDHGFGKVDRQLCLTRALADAGLVQTDARGKITGWDAAAWNMGGSIAVLVARDDPALKARVGAVLDRLRADPANGIARVLDGAAAQAMGGQPQAAFVIGLAPGVMAADWAGKDTPLLAPAHYPGTHGYLPDDPRMRSTLLIAGPGIARGRDLGEIDMRRIAPTLAGLIGARLADAELPPLDLR